MECPNCKKNLADNAKSCPECGYDFTEHLQQKEIQNNFKGGCGCLLIIVIVLACIMYGCVSDIVDETEADKAKNQVTQEDIQQADDYIVTLEAAGLVEKIQNKCADGSQGCYRLLINEYLWNNVTELHVKESLITASDIYFNSKKPYKHFEGVGSKSGKVLFNMWGIKN
jgi:hypothetical protein